MQRNSAVSPISPPIFIFWAIVLRLGREDVRNRGISVDITFGVRQRLKEVWEGHPKKVFILIGINDVSRNIPDSVIVGNYYKIVRQIKKGSPQTKIYFETLLPVNKDFKAFKNQLLLRYIII